VRIIRRFLAAVTTLAIVVLGTPGIAYANKTVRAPLTVSCPNGQFAAGGKFVVTSALSNTTPISINTSVQTLNRAPSSFSGTTNTYDGPFDGVLDKDNLPATEVANNWSGTFTLVSLNCKSPVAPTVAVQASLPGVPGSIRVVVTNLNDIMFSYEVSAPSLGLKTVKVLGRGSNAAVDLTTPTCGTAYQVVVKDGYGTQSAATATMPACPPGPQPSVSPSPSKATPHPSASPSASDSASPEPSASPLVDGSYEAMTVQGGVDPNAAPKPTKKAEGEWSWLGDTTALIGLSLLGIVLVICAWAAIAHARKDNNGSAV
jgi:hypothetical protein